MADGILIPLLRQCFTLAAMPRARLIFVVYFFLVLFGCSSKHKETIIIDGIVKSKKELAKLKPSEIFSRTKWLPREAPSKYNQWNKTTIIFIKTVKVEAELQKQRHIFLGRFLDSLDNGVDVLFVQDGMLVSPKSQKNLRKLLPSQLSNVDTMEWSAAKKLYGTPARPNTVVINTYSSQYNYRH